MSPRRKIQPGERPLLVAPTGRPSRWWTLRRPTWQLRSRQWGLPLTAAAAAVVALAAITACILMLVSHEADRRTTVKDAAVLTYVRAFMAEFTSIDPFHANDYVDRILDQATGDFAKQYQDHANEILLGIARAEPTKGTVLDAGVERWNDDGSATVLVATAVASKSPDGKQVIENTNRWVATAKQEGSQWKISNLLQVM
ncbi:mammalian cell entry protein [Mycobacterium botniense]|uniref:Mce associated protein n=1 Tax=Mycobacterium botniense TaxID=84962 RepID=A0A7I9XVU2_9MYCO|nr:mammalian cell entry protein [Mycobacterium botniense]GFG73903.1 hypothetical protein MBOT_12680 [Mycobacterium botniense]